MNGETLALNFKKYLAALNDRRLMHWINDNAAFPCTMVDRITPRPLEALSQETEEKFGIKNDFTVFAEDFSQWIIEDGFAGARPHLEEVGVRFVTDVRPYEEAKIRLLNGGHSSIAYFGALKGHADFASALRDPELNAFFDAFESEEAIPALGASPVDLPDYVTQIKSRFLNPYIIDAIERICMDGVNKMTIFVRPTLAECYTKGIKPRRAVAVIASWYVFMRRVAQGRAPVPYADPYFQEFSPLLAPGGEALFARKKFLWGTLPESHPEFIAELTQAIAEIEKRFA